MPNCCVVCSSEYSVLFNNQSLYLDRVLGLRPKAATGCGRYSSPESSSSFPLLFLLPFLNDSLPDPAYFSGKLPLLPSELINAHNALVTCELARISMNCSRMFLRMA